MRDYAQGRHRRSRDRPTPWRDQRHRSSLRSGPARRQPCHAHRARVPCAMCSRPIGHLQCPRTEQLVCRCECVTAGDIRKAVAEGFRDVNEVKRFTRCGMGQCQGPHVRARTRGNHRRRPVQAPDAVGCLQVRQPLPAGQPRKLLQPQPARLNGPAPFRRPGRGHETSRRSLSLLCRRGICLLLAASYIVCLCAASLNAAPHGSRSGGASPASNWLPRAENPHLSPDDPALAASIPETSGRACKAGKPVPAPSRDPVAPPVPGRPPRLRDHRLPRHTDIRGLLLPPRRRCGSSFFAEDSIMFSRRIMRRRAAAFRSTP